MAVHDDGRRRIDDNRLSIYAGITWIARRSVFVHAYSARVKPIAIDVMAVVICQMASGVVPVRYVLMDYGIVMSGCVRNVVIVISVPN